MEIAKVEEIMAKIPVEKLRRAVIGGRDGGVWVYWNEGPLGFDFGRKSFHCSIPGSDADFYFEGDRMEPLTSEESRAFLDRMRSVLEANP